MNHEKRKQQKQWKKKNRNNNNDGNSNNGGSTYNYNNNRRDDGGNDNGNRNDEKTISENRMNNRNKRKNNGGDIGNIEDEKDMSTNNNQQAKPIYMHDKWSLNEGSKVSLEVVNNLQRNSVWNGYLETAFRNWDVGTPNTMKLSLSNINDDTDCEASPFKIKVCNGNYGDLPWKGVNYIFIQQDGTILASTMRLNDYYLGGMDSDEKLYTCCHEIGHGLGLRHSDEDFTNRDLYSECMVFYYFTMCTEYQTLNSPNLYLNDCTL